MPNAARTFVRRAPGVGRNPLAGTQSGSFHAGKLPSGEKKKRSLKKSDFFNKQRLKHANADGDRNSWEGRNNFGERAFFEKIRRNLIPKSGSEIKVTA